MTKYIEQLMSEHPDACAAILKAAKSSGFLSDVEVLLKLPDLTDQTFNAKREELKGAGEGTDLLLQELVMPNIDKDFFIDTPANDEDSMHMVGESHEDVWHLYGCFLHAVFTIVEDLKTNNKETVLSEKLVYAGE